MPQQPRITIIGSLNMDLTATSNKRPAAGETILGERFETFPGGKGANQAVAAARLGADVTMIGMVGKDPFGNELTQVLRREGVETEHIGSADTSSGVAVIQVVDGDNSITVIPGANFQLTPDYIETKRDVIQNSDIILIQLEIPLETVAAAAKCCKEVNVPYILNPAPAQSLPEEIINQAAYITPNESEAMILFEDTNKALQEFPDKLVITKGEEGVVYSGGHVAAFPVSAVDTTGAGDTFNAALGLKLASGSSLSEACSYANAAAALQIGSHGAQAGMPTDAEVIAFMRQKRENHL
ncbi:ribokinase [Terribacillus saccharophilus]|uniref:ribokinase n=1 Tax=Terribacillus saccharophilus TaxID=361277 RepID=UPI0037FF41C5